jgi:glycogen debranching enzyme
MNIIHGLGKQAIKKRGEAAFLLSNRTGGYLSLSDKYNVSYYQGLYFLKKNWNMYKTIENIYLSKEPTEVENKFSHIIKRYDESEEKFYFTSEALIYEVSNYLGGINIDLDFREMYDFDENGRIYTIKKEKDLIIVEYQKHTDHSLKEINHKHYLVIKGAEEFEIPDQWVKREYSYDYVRGDRSNFFVYKALRLVCKKDLNLVISYANTKKEAIQNAINTYANRSVLKKTLKAREKKLLNKSDLFFNTAIKALDDLTVRVETNTGIKEGIFAGLPWFFQFWARDELISLKAWMLEGRYDFTKKRLFDYLDSITESGRIPNRLPHSMLESADGVGWLFKRIYDFIIILQEKKLLNKYLSHKDLEFIKHKLHFCLEEHILSHMEHYLIINDKNETWMDTASGDKGRTGARLEIQALFLNFFTLMKELCKLLELPSIGYKQIEKKFLKEIRKVFFREGMLMDGFDEGLDKTVRNNIFLAYYAYPELLKKYEWKLVFKKTLRALWLEWGGVSSLDKKDSLFCADYTGVNNKSYHRGDSWFFVNNLAAVCMLDLDKTEFKYYVDHILTASTEEMMFSGIIGHHTEISSASEMRSEGCVAQAWSAAMLIELMHKLGKK